MCRFLHTKSDVFSNAVVDGKPVSLFMKNLIIVHILSFCRLPRFGTLLVKILNLRSLLMLIQRRLLKKPKGLEPLLLMLSLNKSRRNKSSVCLTRRKRIGGSSRMKIRGWKSSWMLTRRAQTSIWTRFPSCSGQISVSLSGREMHG